MVQTRKILKTAVFESVLFNSDILAIIGPFLAAEDFTNLASTSRHFGGRTFCADHDDDYTTGRTPTGPHANDNAMEQNFSLMEKIARQVIKKEQTGQERASLPRYPGEGWIALYHQLVLLRKSIIFYHLVGEFVQYVDGDKSRVTAASSDCITSAISDHVMRAGKHYVEVTASEKFDMSGRAGIMRPMAKCVANHPQILSERFFSPMLDLDGFLSPKFLGERNERWGDSNVHACQYSFHSGCCYWSDWEQLGGQIDNAAVRETWEGQEDFLTSTGNKTLGLLLDLDEGTLSMYKNGRRLGTMVSGLSGEYCWVVTMGARDDEFSIRRASIPEYA